MLNSNSAMGSIAGVFTCANSSSANSNSSQGTQSLANSTTLTPCVIFSWASNSIKTQSTVAMQ